MKKYTLKQTYKIFLQETKLFLEDLLHRTNQPFKHLTVPAFALLKNDNDKNPYHVTNKIKIFECNSPEDLKKIQEDLRDDISLIEYLLGERTDNPKGPPIQEYLRASNPFIAYFPVHFLRNIRSVFSCIRSFLQISYVNSEKFTPIKFAVAWDQELPWEFLLIPALPNRSNATFLKNVLLNLSKERLSCKKIEYKKALEITNHFKTLWEKLPTTTDLYINRYQSSSFSVETNSTFDPYCHLGLPLVPFYVKDNKKEFEPSFRKYMTSFMDEITIKMFEDIPINRHTDGVDSVANPIICPLENYLPKILSHSDSWLSPSIYKSCKYKKTRLNYYTNRFKHLKIIIKNLDIKPLYSYIKKEKIQTRI